jgi:hypothetical protein
MLAAVGVADGTGGVSVGAGIGLAGAGEVAVGMGADVATLVTVASAEGIGTAVRVGATAGDRAHDMRKMLSRKRRMCVGPAGVRGKSPSRRTGRRRGGGQARLG